MQTHNIVPGTPEWHAHRVTHKNASDAPAMLGCSPYKTRSELIREMATGYVPDVDAGTQARFDDGHRFEAMARPIGEEIIGDDLAPVVGSKGEHSASFDGLTLMGDGPWEHKTLNEEIRAALPHQGRDSHQHNEGAKLGKVYRVQMEQQLLVCGASRNLFSATRWDGSDLKEERHAWYHTDPALRAEILAGWKQADEDKAAYVPAEVVMAPVAKPQMSLPAVSIRVNGSIALVDNLQAFGTALTAYVERINKEPETDQDFADLEATVKALKAAEEALDAAENGALAQTESIDSMRRTVGLYRETARTNRLLVEKLVKVEKENRRTKIISDAVAALQAHVNALQARLGKPYLPAIQGEFQQVVKGLKSIDSMKDKVANELARCKIETNATADRIQANLATLRELASAHAFLFADTAQIVLKANDDLTALVKSRIADHAAAEEKKEAEQRERIRKEEQEKAEKAVSEAKEAEDALVLSFERAARRIEFDSVPYIEKASRQYESTGGDWENDTRPRVVAAFLAGRAYIKDRLDTAKQRAAEAAAVIAAPAAQPIPTAPAITHETVFDVMMPPAVRQAMAPASAQIATAAVELKAAQAAPAGADLSPAAQALNEEQGAARFAKAHTPPTMALGEISTRLGFNCTSVFLASLGFEATTVKAAKLFHSEDFPAICRALIEHIESVCEMQAA